MYDFYAHAYIEYFRSGFRRYSWIFDYVDSLLQRNPQESFSFLLKLLKITHTEEELSWITHIFFEEFLYFHLNAMNEHITIEAKTNRRLKHIIHTLSEEKRFKISNDTL
jgi:hypothetical protein